MASAAFISLVNGVPTSQLETSDRGLAFGDGVFETVRYNKSAPVLLDYHLDRMLSGCARLEIPLSREQVIEQFDQLATLAADNGYACGVAKLLVTRGSGGRGYRSPEPSRPTFIGSWHSLPDHGDSAPTQGVHVDVLSYRLGVNPALAGLKHLNRLDQVLAAREVAMNGALEGLLADIDGRLVEGVATNVFLARGEQWVTPALLRAGIAGTARRYILERSESILGIKIKELDIDINDISSFSAGFLVNSVNGLWPLASINGRTLLPEQQMGRFRALVNSAVSSGQA